MTAAQLASELRIKESYLKSHWNRIKESNSHAGITLVKVGRGDSANYGIRFPGDADIRWEAR